MVSADDVVITNSRDTNEGLQVTFYVQQAGGVLPGAALNSAVQVRNQYIFIILALVIAVFTHRLELMMVPTV